MYSFRGAGAGFRVAFAFGLSALHPGAWSPRIEGLGAWALGFGFGLLGLLGWGLGFRVWGLGFRVWGLGFRV